MFTLKHGEIPAPNETEVDLKFKSVFLLLVLSENQKCQSLGRMNI